MRPDTIEKLIAMLNLQKANLPTYKTQVGATDAEIAELGKDLDNLEYLVEYSDLTETFKRAVNKIKQQLYNGDMDEPISPFPVLDAPAPPNALIAGALERANKRNRRYKAADGYTQEIGIALGIDGDGTGSVSPGDVKPTFDVFAAQTGYEAAVVISNRGKSDMWRVFGRKMNSEKWSDLTSGTGKSGNLTVEATTEGQPERMELKIQLYKNNEPYGQASDPQYVTFNP